jgi:hypothetical protein
MTTKYLRTILLACLALVWAAGCDDGGNGNEDVDVDVTPDDVTHDDVTTDDVTPDDVTTDDVTTDDVTTDDVVADDTPEEEALPCPDDSPPTHIYIDVAGLVRSLDGTTAVGGTIAVGISPLDALTNPTPTPLATSAVDADGAFGWECMDAGPVTLGLVILHDDAPEATDNFYPTGTGVAAWASATDKVDLPDAAVFGVSNTLLGVIEAATSVDADTNGLAMGVIVNGTTGVPVDAATISRSGGTAIDVFYPNATFTGAESDGNTSANGVFIITEPIPTLIADLTATATDLTFGEHQAATKGGFIYFLVIAGE